MEYYAHRKETADGQIVWQTVWAHLVGAARRAAECLRPVGLKNSAYLAALLHDIGKFTAAFQQYLAAGDRSARGRVIHSFQGCRYLLEQFHHENDSVNSIMSSELLAFAVGAHHSRAFRQFPRPFYRESRRASRSPWPVRKGSAAWFPVRRRG